MLIDEQRFERDEGIAFNGEEEMYITASRALWQVALDGATTKVCDPDSNLGLARIGPRDLICAYFRPPNVFRDGSNADGIVWRIRVGASGAPLER